MWTGCISKVQYRFHHFCYWCLSAIGSPDSLWFWPCSGLRPGKFNLSYPAQVLLHLVKIRKGESFNLSFVPIKNQTIGNLFFFPGFDNRTLACLFNVSRMTIWKTWWRILFHAYNMSDQIPKMWTRSDLEVIRYHAFLIICKILSVSSFSGRRYWWPVWRTSSQSRQPIHPTR